MKHGEHAQLSAKWWNDSQPRGLSSARRLGDALKDYEAAKHALKTHATEAAAKAALAALASIEVSAKAVIFEAAKRKDPEMQATSDALRELGVSDERDWVAAQSSNDADDSADSPLGAAGYPGYLLRALRRLRTVPMNFGLVLGHRPEDHRLWLHRVMAPMALGHRLAQETGIHLMTCGIAAANDDRARTILLTVEGRQLPGLKRKAERMLRFHRPLPFQFVGLFAGGAEVEDIEDENDHDIDVPFDADPARQHEVELLAEIERIRPRLSAAMAGSSETRAIIMSEVQRFVSRLKASDLPGARASIISLHALIPGEGFSIPKSVPPDTTT
jgi:hypothetical protein